MIFFIVKIYKRKNQSDFSKWWQETIRCKKSKVWSTNDANKLMRQIIKQQICLRKWCTWKKKFLGTRALQNVITIFSLLFLVKTILKLSFHLTKVQRFFLMICSLAKWLWVRKSNTYVVVLTLLMESAQNFWSLLYRTFRINFCLSSVAV